MTYKQEKYMVAKIKLYDFGVTIENQTAAR